MTCPSHAIVELVRGIATSEETIDCLKDWLKKLAKFTNSEDFPLYC